MEEGQRVKKGDLLIELDSTLKGADLDGLKKSLSLARLEREIYSLELENKNIEFERILDKYSYLDDEDIYSQHRFFLARNIEYLGKKEELRLDISQNESELKMAKVNYLKLENRVKTLSVEEDNLKYLSGIGGMSKREWINKESEVYIATQEVEAQKSLINSLSSKLKESEKKLENFSKERQSQILNKLVEIEKKIFSLKTELVKAERHFNLRKFYSPVDGTVNALGVFTIGGVVSATKPMITIVPVNTPLIIEVNVLNRDIGFINLDQEVEIKLDTFPFQKHGILEGKVKKISPDAFEDEKMGLTYKVEITPTKNNVKHNGQEIILSPGMSLTAEVKTGRRRIIEFFLSPLIKYADESLTLR